MEDVHIIQNKDDEKPSKTGGSKSGVIISVLALIAVFSYGAFNYYITETSVQGVQTELEEGIDSIKFESSNEVINEISPMPSKVLQATDETLKTTLPKTLIIKSESLDGYVSSTDTVNLTQDILVGNTETEINRGVVSFSLDAIPQGVQIEKALLRLYQIKVVGSPFGNFGQIQFDHIDLGSNLEALDYDSASLQASFVSLPQSTVAGWKEINVSEQVKADIQMVKTQSQFRIHFANEKLLAKPNSVSFESSENWNHSGDTPQLVVSY